MYLVSTGKSTVLSDFADLETKSTYEHKNGEARDFQFYTNSEIFVEVNKKAGLEVMRIKEGNDNDIEIQRVRKLKIENGYCVACARQSLNEIALGLSNGQVRIYNYREAKILHRYDGDKRNSVIFLDYNASDEYISAVQENGLINVYGKKTGVKLESINIDLNTTLARFHPSKRFQLAIASYKGAVTAYDISSKRKTFHSVDTHSAPCRDLCMSLAIPDTLISVGYDCVINIFDTRRKGQPIRLSHNHPLSTVALSDCGNFFCVGSLKGELSTYDMRNTQSYLCVKKIHDCAVNRVAFVPQVSKEQKTCALSSTNTTLGALTEQRSEPPTKTRSSLRDSFGDFFDIQINKCMEKTSSRLTVNTGRESFDWEVLARKTSSKYRGSGGNTRGLYSFGDSFENKQGNVETSAADLKTETRPSVTNNAPLRESNHFSGQQISPVGKLKEIEEEQQLQQTIQESNMNISSGSDKENPQIQLELHRQVKSTPIGSSPDHQLTNENNIPLHEVQKLFDNFRANIDDRLHRLEYDLKLNAEQNKFETFTQSFNLWIQHIDKTDEIRNALSILLQTDPFVVEFNRLKEENKILKAQLERLLIKKK